MSSTQRDSFPPSKRKQVLANDAYRCQTCGAKGPENGGAATLEAHHIEDDPDGMEYHDPANGTTLCTRCHHFVTTRIPDDLPFDIEEIGHDLKLLPYDLEILSVLARTGPSTIAQIRSEIDNSKSTMATRERLWYLMGHDLRIDDLTHPLVDRDVETGEWGLPHQIESSARGHLPDEKQTLVKRVEDEMTRRLLDQGIDRARVAEIMDCHERTTHYQEKRARAFRIPIGDRPVPSEDASAPDDTEYTTLESFLTSGQADEPAREVTDSTPPSAGESSEEIETQLSTLITDLESVLEVLTADDSHAQVRTSAAND